MKITFLPLLLILGMPFFAEAQSFEKAEWAESRFYPVKQNNRWGVIDQNGALRIPAEYEHIIFGLKHDTTYYPYFLVRVAEDKWGLLDTLGKELLPPVYCQIKLLEPSIPYFATEEDCSTLPKIKMLPLRVNALPPATLARRRITLREKIIRFRRVWKSDSLRYKINVAGKMGLEHLRKGSLIATVFDSLWVYPEKGYVLSVQRSRTGKPLYGIFDLEGRELLPNQFSAIQHLDASFLAVKDTSAGEWRVLHPDGYELPRRYRKVGPYREQAFKLVHLQKRASDGRQGYDYFEPEGRILRRNLYYPAERLFGPYMKYSKNNYTWGVVDDDGAEVLPPIYPRMKHIGRGFLRVRRKSKAGGSYGVIDIRGKEILPLIYTDVTLRDDLADRSLFYAELDRHFQLFEENGKCLTPDGPYHSLKPHDPDGYSYKVLKEGKKGTGFLTIEEGEGAYLEWMENFQALSVNLKPERGTWSLGVTGRGGMQLDLGPPKLLRDSIGQLYFERHLLDADRKKYSSYQPHRQGSDERLPLGAFAQPVFPTEGRYVRYTNSFYDEQLQRFEPQQHLLDTETGMVISPPGLLEIPLTELVQQERGFFMGELLGVAGNILFDKKGKIVCSGMEKPEKVGPFFKVPYHERPYAAVLSSEGVLLADSLEDFSISFDSSYFRKQQYKADFFSLVDSSFNTVMDSLVRFTVKQGFYLVEKLDSTENLLLNAQREVLQKGLRDFRLEQDLLLISQQDSMHQTLINKRGQLLLDNLLNVESLGSLFLIDRLETKNLELMDTLGRILQKDIVSFQEGASYHVLAVRKGVQVHYGLIDSTGAWQIRPQYRALELPKDGLLLASDAPGKWGIVNLTGDWLVRPLFGKPFPINDNTGLSGYVLRKQLPEAQWRLLNSEGRYISLEGYNGIGQLQGRYISLRKESGWGMLKTDGTLQLPFVYEDLDIYRKGYAAAKKNGHWGLLDSEQQLVLDFAYESLGLRFGQYLPAKQKQSWGLFSEMGMAILDCKYEDIGYLNNGLLKAKKGKGWQLFDAEGGKCSRKKYQEVSDFNARGMAQTQGKRGLGLIDEAGQQVLAPRYDELQYYHQAGFILARKGKRWGLFTKDGRRLLRNRYTRFTVPTMGGLATAARPRGKLQLFHLGQGRLPIRSNDSLVFNALGHAIVGQKTLLQKSKYGLLDEKGQWVLAPQYEAIRYMPRSQTYQVRDKAGWGFVDAQGRWRSERRYKKVSDFVYTDSAACVQLGRKLYALRNDSLLPWSVHFEEMPAAEQVSEKELWQPLAEYSLKAQKALVFPSAPRLEPLPLGQYVAKDSMIWAEPAGLKKSLLSIGIGAPAPLLTKEEKKYRLHCKTRMGASALSNYKYPKAVLLSEHLAGVYQTYSRRLYLREHGAPLPEGDFDSIRYMGGGLFQLEQELKIGYWHQQRGWIWPLQE